MHGLWVHGVIMAPLRRRIARCGYDVASFSYPSLRLTLTENAQRLAQHCRGLRATRLHFVGHSLGGLVVLRSLGFSPGAPVGRVVLMGTPYGGSHAARRLALWPGGRAALGRCLPEWLGAARPALDARLEIGVIAGSRPVGLGRLVAPDLPAPCDGAVAVAETRLPAMRDHIVLEVSHTGMLFSRTAAAQVCAFLRNGAFRHDA